MNAHDQGIAQRDRLSWGVMAVYGAGAFVNNLVSGTISAMMIVLNLGLGLDPAVVGLLAAIPRFMDALTDPIIGYISDNTQTKWGRRRPFIFVGAIVTGLAFILLWQLPEGRTDGFYFWYFLVVSLVFYLAYTVFATPWVALGYEMTPDYHERTRLMGVQNFIGQLAYFIPPWLLLLMQNDQYFNTMVGGAAGISIPIGVFVMCVGVLPAIFLKERWQGAGRARKGGTEKSRSRINIARHMKGFASGFSRSLRFMPFVKICTATFLVFNGFILISAFQVYVIIYYVFAGDQEQGAQLAAYVGSIKTVSTLGAIALVTWISTRIGKRRAFILSTGLSMVGYALNWFCYNPSLPWLILLPAPLTAFGLGGLFTLMPSMMADVVDFDELQTGERREGMFGSIFWWVVKLGLAASLAGGGFLLSATGFDLAAGGAQSDQTIFLMRLLDAACPVLASAGAIWLIAHFGLTETRMTEIRTALEERRGRVTLSSAPLIGTKRDNEAMGNAQHRLEQSATGEELLEARIADLIGAMTLSEKIGQLRQVDASQPGLDETIAAGIRAGAIGSIINQTDRDSVSAYQRIAMAESRLGIPLLVGRDVIHGFRTIMPIPLAQACTFNPDLVRDCAHLSAREASCAGVNWTFAPMIDIARDARWGRIAESFGEDPFLSSALGVAMIEGFQGRDLAAPTALAACAKHFAGYGASESGRDYDVTNIPDNELRNVYLPPFEAALAAGVQTFMTSFSDIDGVPATANTDLLKGILRDEWGFDGLVVSDWNAISELTVHGIAEDHREAALIAAQAGVDMEMAGDAYADHLPGHIECRTLDEASIDQMVSNVLRVKFRLGLFDGRVGAHQPMTEDIAVAAKQIAYQAALESVVLLKNDGAILPIDKERPKRIALVGPLADAPYEQLGTWIFDGDPSISETPLQAFREKCGALITLHHEPAFATTRARDAAGLERAVRAAEASDLAIAFVGEESILSGEAHSRADIDLPGEQMTLLRRLKATGKPVIAVIMAGRPLTLSGIIDYCDAILFAGHPGTMAGPAIVDLLLGKVSPSGRLPVSFPTMVGQIPIYYNRKNTGRPATSRSVMHIDAIEPGATQTSFGMTAFHLDAGFEPLYPFGYGLTYTEFRYAEVFLNGSEFRPGDVLTARLTLKNCGTMAAHEVVQLYIRDVAGSITRPVRELKAFEKVFLEPGAHTQVTLSVPIDALAFYGRDKHRKVEPGLFHLWVGPDATRGEQLEFRVVGANA